MKYFRWVNIVFILLFFTGIFFWGRVNSENPLVFFIVFAALRIAITVIENMYFRKLLNSGFYKCYEIEPNRNSQISALILLLLMAVFILLIFVFLVQDFDLLYFYFFVLALCNLSLYGILRYRYDHFLFANDKEIINYPVGAYFKWSENFIAENNKDQLELKYAGLKSALAGERGKVTLTGEQRDRFLSDFIVQIQSRLMG